MPFFLQNSFLATLMLISRRPVQRRGLVKNVVFSLRAGRYRRVNRELKQQRRRRLRKRHLKSEFVLLQTLSRLFHLVYFVKILANPFLS